MQRIQLAAEIGGYAALTAAAFLVAIPLGLAVAGAALVWVGNARLGKGSK